MTCRCCCCYFCCCSCCSHRRRRRRGRRCRWVKCPPCIFMLDCVLWADVARGCLILFLWPVSAFPEMKGAHQVEARATGCTINTVACSRMSVSAARPARPRTKRGFLTVGSAAAHQPLPSPSLPSPCATRVATVASSSGSSCCSCIFYVATGLLK